MFGVLQKLVRRPPVVYPVHALHLTHIHIISLRKFKCNILTTFPSLMQYWAPGVGENRDQFAPKVRAAFACHAPHRHAYLTSPTPSHLSPLCTQEGLCHAASSDSRDCHGLRGVLYNGTNQVSSSIQKMALLLLLNGACWAPLCRCASIVTRVFVTNSIRVLRSHFSHADGAAELVSFTRCRMPLALHVASVTA
jgi:hypothetical protein